MGRNPGSLIEREAASMAEGLYWIL
jgi:hypothetical protein